MEEKKEYDRDKALAIVTGIVCALIFCAGTLLGSYHAIISIGVFAGLLATACYLIGDIAIAWAAYIDYQEDGTPLEWASWVVKYGLSFYLLFSGGCIAYTLFSDAARSSGRHGRVERALEAQKKCLANYGDNPKPSQSAACQKVYDSTLKSEVGEDSEREKKKGDKSEWVVTFTEWPLFNYLPGILGLSGLLLMTFVVKLTKKRKKAPDSQVDTPAETLRDSPGQAAVRQSRRVAAFDTQAELPNRLRPVSSPHGTFSFSQSGNGVALRWRERGKNTKHVVYVNTATAERLSRLDYQSLLAEALRLRAERQGHDDGLVTEMGGAR